MRNDGHGQGTHRVYALSQTHSNKISIPAIPPVTPEIILAIVDHPERAVTPPYTDFSDIRTNVGLIGIGQAWQNLRFNQILPANSPVICKMAVGATVLNVLNNIRVQATLNGSGVDAVYTGTTLLGLLSGNQVSEIVFTPSLAFDGVRITINPLVDVVSSANFYYAFYIRPPQLNPIDLCADEQVWLTVLDHNPSDSGKYKYRLYLKTAPDIMIMETSATESSVLIPDPPIGTTAYLLERVEVAGSAEYPSAKREIEVTVRPSPSKPTIHANE